MIKQHIRLGPPPRPLNAIELARVHQWHLHMTWFYAVALAFIALGYVAMFRFADAPWLIPTLLTMLLALMIGGAYVQFRERCPRCNVLLGRQARVVLPKECKNCGVEFPRPTTTDQAPRV